LNASETTTGPDAPEPNSPISAPLAAAASKPAFKRYEVVVLFLLGSLIIDSLFPPLLHVFLCLFGVWFVYVWGWRRFSGGFKLALTLCALASFGGWWSLKSQEERTDWTSHSLNPERPGFKPAVVLLAGTYDFNFYGSPHGPPDSSWIPAGSAQFEIRMRSGNYYYADRWTKTTLHEGSFDALLLSMNSFVGSWDYVAGGSGIRCHHWQMETNDGLLPLRRLWRGDEFIGAADVLAVSTNGTTEQFSELKQFGPYQIPQRIEITDSSRHEVYHVRRVEFLNEPDTNWFWWIREKYFDGNSRGSPLWKTNLNEAGWPRERKF
jgi:hypothetical protein